MLFRSPESSRARVLIILCWAALLSTACGGGGGGGESTGRNAVRAISSISIPEQTDDGWEPASLAEVGLTEQPLVDALNGIRQGDFNEIHGIVVIRNGKLVLEDYGRGRMYDGSPDDNFTPTITFDRDSMHILHSVSKSFMSTLAGIAIRDGYIPGIESSVLSFFPEHGGAFGPEKDGILLKHLMTMSSGLQWNEWDTSAMDFRNSDAIRYQQATDPSAYFFGKELLHVPGSTFYYNTAGFQMMGEIIRRATGMDLADYANQRLFQPLGIDRFEWPQYAHGSMYLVGDQGPDLRRAHRLQGIPDLRVLLVEKELPGRGHGGAGYLCRRARRSGDHGLPYPGHGRRHHQWKL